MNLAYALMPAGQYTEAAEAYAAALGCADLPRESRAQVLTFRGKALHKAGMEAEAAASFEEAKALQ